MDETPIAADELEDTLAAVESNQELADVTFRAETEWLEDLRSETVVEDFDQAGEQVDSPEFTLEADEPQELLGQRTAPNPAEYLLAALGSCLTISYAANATARDIELRSLRFEFAGDIDLHGFLGLDESVRNGFKEITVTTHIDADASEDELAKLQSAAESASSIMDNITNEVPVSTEIVLIDN
jgi:uncharacterized OsmC-like protein